ncbi:MAG: hypothetical protein RLZZ618_3288 [Pseudomonadota bacterium]|jgi:putative membrane protein
MNTLRDALAIARLEAGMFKRFGTLWLTVVAVVLIPAIYALIYLSSVWDPAARAQSLPALIVNLDVGVTYRGQSANVGVELAGSLKESKLFGFVQLDDEERARRTVREGRAALALIIPRDFSANAVPGRKAGAGQLIVYTSEGNNYASAGMARRFAAELGHQVNETLNERRWALVLQTAAGSEQSVRQLKEAVSQLRVGSHDLERGLQQADTGAKGLGEGARKLNDAAGQLVGGVKQLGSGVRTMESKRPSAADLQALRYGAHALVDNHAELGRGLDQLHGGAERLTEGAKQLREEGGGIPFVGDSLAEGANKLADGGQQLATGLLQARQGQRQLADGASKLHVGVVKLTDGVSALGDGIHTMAVRLPEDTKLDQFHSAAGQLAQGNQAMRGGIEKLQQGAARLAAGLDLLQETLPSDTVSLDGSARGLADSVQPVMEVVAPVPNNGTGFTPNFVPVALWLGAVMTAFLFHIRRLPEAARGKSRLAQFLGKLAMLVVIVLAQATCVLLMLTLLLDVKVPHLLAFWLTLALASVTFLLIIVALTRAFGDIGKGIALLLLVLQLSSAGGVLPIELSGEVFRGLNPWLPFTWVVRAFRASLFGAYDNAWLSAWAVILMIASIAFVMATWVGKWWFVKEEDHRPALDI